jgi:monofunctional biosynthetic peptidoglycan transglycosylase
VEPPPPPSEPPDAPPAALPPPSSASSPPPPRSSPRRWRRVAGRAAEVALAAAALAALGLHCSVPDTAPLATENPRSTAFIDLRREAAEAAGKPFELRWQWRSLGSISRYLRAAVIYAEDYEFYRHDGIDWSAVEHAMSTAWDRGAMSIGGSTITQQVAKNLYLSPSRSLIRKAREVLIAYALEDHLSKQRILELYLNIAEWGDGVFGAEAAANAWFHHSAQSLSPAEAVRLAVALPNPRTRAPSVRDPDLTRKSVRLIRMLRMQGLLDAAQERTALDGVGAHDVRVLPDRAVAAGGVPPAAADAPAPTPQNREPPAADREPPAADRESPAADREPPAADREPPAADREPPAADREPPAEPAPSAPPPPPPAGELPPQ